MKIRTAYDLLNLFRTLETNISYNELTCFKIFSFYKSNRTGLNGREKWKKEMVKNEKIVCGCGRTGRFDLAAKFGRHYDSLELVPVCKMRKIDESGKKHEPRWPSVEPGCFSGPRKWDRWKSVLKSRKKENYREELLGKLGCSKTDWSALSFNKSSVLSSKVSETLLKISAELSLGGQQEEECNSKSNRLHVKSKGEGHQTLRKNGRRRLHAELTSEGGKASIGEKQSGSASRQSQMTFYCSKMEYRSEQGWEKTVINM